MRGAVVDRQQPARLEFILVPARPGLRLRRFAQQRAHAQYQNLRAFGFGNVIVGPAVEAVALGFLAVAGGQHQDRQTPGIQIQADTPAQFVPLHAG